MTQDNLRHAQYGDDGIQVDDPQNLRGFTDLQIRAAISGAGKFVGKSSVLHTGDSISNYGVAAQNITASTSAFPFVNGAFSIDAYSWANGTASNGTLTFNKSASTLTWAAPGENAGTAVNVSRAGVYTIPSSTAAKTITVICRPRLYSASTEGAFTVTFTAGTEIGRRNGKCAAAWIHAKCGAGFDQTFLGNGGSQIADITECLSWQVTPGQYDLIHVHQGTNNVSNDHTLAQMQADTMAQLTLLQTLTPLIVMDKISPRSTSMTTTRREVLHGYNTWLDTLRIPGLHISNVFTPLVDPDNVDGDPLAALVEDGLHPSIRGAEIGSRPTTQIFIDLLSIKPYPVASSRADSYNATNNPQGNQLTGGGTFTGTAGNVAGAGMAVAPAWAGISLIVNAGQPVITGGRLYISMNAGGTTSAAAPIHTAGQALDGTVLWQFLASGVVAGLADNWIIARDSGADILGYCAKVPRSDGLPGNAQRIILLNPGATSQTVSLMQLNAARPTVATGQIWGTKGSFTPLALSGCEYFSVNMIPDVPGSGRMESQWGTGGTTSAMSGTQDKLTGEPFPLKIPSGATKLQCAFRARLSAGGSAMFDLWPGEWELNRLS